MADSSRNRDGTKRLLVAGIGNIFLGDDGFGVAVASKLAGQALAPGVEVADFGIRGIHLAYELSGGAYDSAILVDAVSRGGRPGTLYVIEPDLRPSTTDTNADPHSLTPDAVLALLQQIGVGIERLIIVGCEPATLDESMGLSEPVAAAVDSAIGTIRGLVEEMTGAASCA
jgi:hydrogenase maturation protease